VPVRREHESITSARWLQDLGHGGLEAFVRVRDHEVHARAGRAVVLRLAYATSVGSERHPCGQPEGSEVMAEAEAKPVERAEGVGLRRSPVVHDCPRLAGLPVDERPFEEHR
jgi:hypothetical protein